MKLSDKFTLERGRVYLTGIQALVRLPLDQMRRDRRAGMNTGAFISGYEGSPLGGYDMALTRVSKLLGEHNVHFRPGVNEDLAATAVMGSQIYNVIGSSKVEGVVGIWYGKGPGVDRSGDIFRHANLAGTGKNCAALVLCGDDHISKSSTIPHQSDFSLFNLGIPFLYPGNTQEIIEYGLMAIALSRFSGAWVGMKMVTDVCDGGGTVEVNPDEPSIQVPGDYQKYTDTRLIPPVSLLLENETNIRRLEAVQAFARANRLNRHNGAAARIGILSAGKPYYDLMQALRDLGLRDDEIRIGKVGMPFPLQPDFVRDFARGLETILVVEEKRSFLELQLREILYDMPSRPAVLGKSHFAPTGELDPDKIAAVLPDVLKCAPRPVPTRAQQPALRSVLGSRPAAFCSGCPHNRSTLLLEGQITGGGIGCHTLAISDEKRGIAFLTHMGGEGAPWIGMEPFVNRPHIFQNIGDGTLFHSGSLAIEACIAAKVNITYKILYNGHVAMTGGQNATGALSIPDLTRKLAAEGVRRTVILAEDVAKYARAQAGELASNTDVRSRDELARTLREMEQIPGVTAIIYDQECAAEKRRKRSRGLLAEPTLRLVINEEVCEGCGDCVKQSNCMSLTPILTERGQKIRIHQSSCNKDYTCLMGDCPSFVSVQIKPGTGLRKKQLPQLPAAELPVPRRQVKAGDGYRIIAPGIGGTGVVTINALLAAAAWMDGLHVATLDQTGTSQKGGAVVSHLLLSENPIEAPAKINNANADLILGFDLLGVIHPDNLKTACAERTVAVINTDLVPTIDSIRSHTPLSGAAEMLDLINSVTRRGQNIFADANRLAEALFGSHMAVNIFLTGVAYQAGLVPVSLESMQKAVELNAVDVERNLRAFLWGRKYYQDAQSVENLLAPETKRKPQLDRAAELRDFQDASYARQYTDFLQKIPDPSLREVVAVHLYKLMAYKDEYEVARLLTKPEFEQHLRDMWESVDSVSYNLHPPLLRRFGLRKKMKLGPWFRTPLLVLKKLKILRGSPLDVFGYSAHRRQERALIRWYRDLIEQVVGNLRPDNLATALEIVALPDQIRGYEAIKEQSIAQVKRLAAEKLNAMKTSMAVASA